MRSYGHIEGRPFLHRASDEWQDRRVRGGGWLVEAGDGEPVLVLHGLAESSRWCLPLGAALRQRYRVLIPDLPGHGRTPVLSRPFRMRDVTNWIAALLDEIEIDSATVVGNSFGGRLAVELALQHARRVKRLVAVSAPLVVGGNRRYTSLARAFSPWAASLVTTPLWWTPAGRAIEGRLGELARRSFTADPSAVSGQLAELVDEAARWLGARESRELYLSVLRRIYLGSPEKLWDRLALLVPPALFIWGANDRFVAAAQAHAVRRAAAGPTVLVVDDCGHSLYYEQPDAVFSAIESFLVTS